MNKVMTRAQHHPGARPPGRRDPRRPGGTPPRSPGDGGPRSRTRPADSRPSAAPGTSPGRGVTAPVDPSQTPRRPLVPQPRPTDVFADLLLGVLSGQRPVHSMLRHTVGRAYDELAQLAEHGLLRTRGTRPVVRDVGYYVPRAGAVEAFARIGAGDQLRAMAFRLEQSQDLRWRCTAVELGGPRTEHTDND